MRPGPKPKDDSDRIPSHKTEYRRAYHAAWLAKSKSTCPCSRPKVGMKDGVEICAVCSEIESKKPKRMFRPNPDAAESADSLPVHLPSRRYGI